MCVVVDSYARLAARSNTLGIPVAAGLLFPIWHLQLPPAAAGFCMAMSSVSVVTSSLLLRKYEPPPGMRAFRTVVNEAETCCSKVQRRLARRRRRRGYQQTDMHPLLHL